jgi:hypothetical protein
VHRFSTQAQIAEKHVEPSAVKVEVWLNPTHSWRQQDEATHFGRCAITRLHAKSSKSVSGAPARILRQWQLHIAMVAIGILVLFVEKISPPL